MTKMIVRLPCNGRGPGQDTDEHIASCPTCNARQKDEREWIKKQETEATPTVLPKNR
jgi:hypothetical protein